MTPSASFHAPHGERLVIGPCTDHLIDGLVHVLGRSRDPEHTRALLEASGPLLALSVLVDLFDRLSYAPTEEEVRMAAYYRWIDACCPPGDGVDFWLDAEEELTRALVRPERWSL
jgi:hypothetical protein